MSGTVGGVIYDLLETCSNESLAPIVKALRNSPASVLGSTRGFEKHHPDHARYTDEIGDEVHRLAREALGRSDGVRVSYVDMLAALFEYVRIPAAGDLATDEALLLNLFFKRHPSSLSDAERAEMVAGASAAVAKATESNWSLKPWPILASVLLMIVDLRLRAERSPKDAPKRNDDDGHALVIKAADGDPILSVMPAREETSGWVRATDGGKASDAFMPIFEAMKPLVSPDQLLKHGNYYRVVLPPGARLDQITGSTAFHGSAHQGREFCAIILEPASAIRLAAPGALLNLASAMAEQKKFEAIERSLAEIKVGLGAVARFQKDERRSVLSGSIAYFAQVAPSVLSGEHAAEVLHQIEGHEADLVRVQDQLLQELRREIDALRAVRKDGRIASKHLAPIHEAQSAVAATCEEILLCVRARACGYQLLSEFPGREHGRKDRARDLRRMLDMLSPAGEIGLAIDEATREKTSLASSYETKAALLAREDELFGRLAVDRALIMDALDAVDVQTAPEGRSVAIDVCVEDGRMVALRAA